MAVQSKRRKNRARDKRYVRAGFVTQCAVCKRVRRVDGPERWELVEAWLENEPDNVSHGLCIDCFRREYPQLAERYFAQRESK